MSQKKQLQDFERLEFEMPDWVNELPDLEIELPDWEFELPEYNIPLNDQKDEIHNRHNKPFIQVG